MHRSTALGTWSGPVLLVLSMSLSSCSDECDRVDSDSPFAQAECRIERLMEKRFDYLVIGSGVAGLFYSLKVLDHDPDARIAIITKKTVSDTNTNRAQGGIAAVLSTDDSVEAHVKDTLDCGCGLCHEDVVRRVVELGPTAVGDLIEMGVRFSRSGSGLALGREGGHSFRRGGASLLGCAGQRECRLLGLLARVSHAFQALGMATQQSLDLRLGLVEFHGHPRRPEALGIGVVGLDSYHPGRDGVLVIAIWRDAHEDAHVCAGL